MIHTPVEQAYPVPGMGTGIEQSKITGVSLSKITNPPTCGICMTKVADLNAHWNAGCTPKTTPVQGEILIGHRTGLRKNDLITLASALWVHCLREGNLHKITDY